MPTIVVNPTQFLKLLKKMRRVNISFAVFFRIHHRSGMYGLFAPEGVGSNFLTLGIKRAWQ